MYIDILQSSRSSAHPAWGLLESILQLRRCNSFADRRNKQCRRTKYLPTEWMWI